MSTRTTKKKRASTSTSKSSSTQSKGKRASTKSGGSKSGGSKKKRGSSKKKAKQEAAESEPDRGQTTEEDALDDDSSAELEQVHPPAEAAVAAMGQTVAIYESTPSNQKRAAEVIAQLGYQVVPEKKKQEILDSLSGSSRPDVLVVGVPGGEEVIRAALEQGSDRPILLASMAGPAGTARARCEQAEADLFTLRPHGVDHLSSALHAAGQLAVARDRVQALRGTEELLRERLARYGQADLTTGFQHFDFFRRFLVMELKRAKRYGYSLAAVLVAIDPRKEDEPEPSAEAARKLRTRVASAISSSIRDIDLPIDYAEDRMLVFLPYTDLDGATRVGKRVAAAVRSYGSVNDRGTKVIMSVSIGIAALKPGKPVSFARLMKDAGAAVRAAQLKGGGRIVVRK